MDASQILVVISGRKVLPPQLIHILVFGWFRDRNLAHIGQFFVIKSSFEFSDKIECED